MKNIEPIIGDYIGDSGTMGEIIGIGYIGNKIPAYQIKTPFNTIDYIVKGQEYPVGGDYISQRAFRGIDITDLLI